MDIAIVTGAGSGLGLAITRKLIELGLRVYGLGGQYDDARFDHEYFVPMPCNLGNLTDVRAKLDEIISREGSNIYVLVNNAKLYHHKSLAETSDEEMELAMKVNLLCPLAITRMALPSLTRLGGFVINIVANTAENSRGGAIGAATAGGLRWMGEALFEQLREDGVKVSNVFPQTNRWRPDGSVPASQRPQSAIDLDAVAEAVGSIILNRYNNVITDVVIRPQRLAEKPVPPPFNVPYPKPQPLPKTTPREKEAHVTLAETRAEIHRHEHDLLRQLREREEAGLDEEDLDMPSMNADERDIDAGFHPEGIEEPGEREDEAETESPRPESSARPEGSGRRRRGRRGGRNRRNGERGQQQGQQPSQQQNAPRQAENSARAEKPAEPAAEPEKKDDAGKVSEPQPARRESRAERDERFERETRPQQRRDGGNNERRSSDRERQEPAPAPAEASEGDATQTAARSPSSRRRNRRNRRPSGNGVPQKSSVEDEPASLETPDEAVSAPGAEVPVQSAEPAEAEKAPVPVAEVREVKPEPKAAETAKPEAPAPETVAEEKPEKAPAKRTRKTPAKPRKTAAQKMAEAGEAESAVAEEKPKKAPAKRTRKTPAKPRKTAAQKKAEAEASEAATPSETEE